MSRGSGDEPLHLLSQDGQDEGVKRIDIESGEAYDAEARPQNLDHEYSIPSTVKFTWLGTYFMFSLTLTLYNKLVLGMVRPSVAPCCPSNGNHSAGLALVLIHRNVTNLAGDSFTSHGCSRSSMRRSPAWGRTV